LVLSLEASELINHKLTIYSLAGILVSIGIVYCLVANSEYEDSKELSDMGIKGETAEKQFEASFFVSSSIVNFILAVLVIKSGRSIIPYLVSGGISAGLVAIYVASRTVGVPVVGVEYYIGRLDMISKILQAVAVVLSGIAIYSIRSSRALKKIIN
jgi:hypothetical protein